MLTRPPAVSEELGQDAIDLAAAAGLHLYPWQQEAVRAILATREDGKFAAFEAGLLCSRQNGKGSILEAIELCALFHLQEPLILHSAHEFKTAQEAFLRIKSLIDNTDALRRQVARVRTSHGEEGIELANGCRLRFVARSRNSGRGFSGTRVILDEAQQLPRAAVGALMPTLSAQPNPQLIYTGTVPAGIDDGEHFESVCRRGREGMSSSLVWLEWSADHVYEPQVDDLEVWAQANPSLGYRIDPERVQSELESMGAEEFKRERLSWWPEQQTNAVLDLDQWAALADVADRRPEPVALAVEVSKDRQWARVALAGLRPDGHHHVQLVDSKKGTGWVVARVKELADKWSPVATVLDPGSPAGSLVPNLAEAGIDAMLLTSRDVAAACGAFADGVKEATIHHPADNVLDVAVAAATQRYTAGAWIFDSADRATDISPLRAVTFARWGLMKSAAKPKRTGEVVGIR